MVGSSARMPSAAPGRPDLRQPRAQPALARDERRAARRAALLGVVIGEEHAFVGDAVDVRRPVAHHALGEYAEVRLADVVAPDDEDVGFLLRLLCHRSLLLI